MPEVSVVVPCYNQAQYLSSALDSVLMQTSQNWECIIINDGSTDNTENIAMGYCGKDNRFKYVCKENRGLSSARNTGIKNSSGEFILPLDADDLIGESYIGKAVEHFRNFPETKLVYCKAQFFGEREGEWNLEGYHFTKLLFENIIFCTAMYKRKDYDATSGYNEDLLQGYEDWDFWLTLLSETDNVYKIPDTCFYYRIKEQSMTTLISDQTRQILFRKIFNNNREKFEKYLPDLIWVNPRVKQQQSVIITLESDLKRIQLSNAYRLGKFIIKPFSYLKSRLRLG